MSKLKKRDKNSPASSGPDKQQNQLYSLQVAQFSSGPIPHPKILAEYDILVPGAAKDIIGMAVRQSEHRQKLEAKVIEADIKNAGLGLWFGLIIGLTAIIGGVVCVLTGHDWAGAAIGGTGVAGLAGTFIYGSRQKIKERQENRKAQQQLMEKKNQL